MATAVNGALLFRNCRIFIAAPYDELMAHANRALQQGLLIAGSLVALGILSAVMLAGLISRSLQQLTSGANRLQDLDFQTPISVRSSVLEISTLSQALNQARDAIFTFALYVPRELVRAGIRSGEFSRRVAARQEVTALFTDIYDFTTISEQHSPEEVVTMLSDYFDVLNQAVGSHNGTIIQFLGDSIFAMWNAPVKDELHAENACRSALTMQSALERFNAAQAEKGLPPFRTRVGIHCGVAVVGSVGASDRLQYTAMGDTINVASRLEGMNKLHGTMILASAAVHARCRDRIRFQALGEGKAKGRLEAIDLFEVVGLIDDGIDHRAGLGR
jgi:adenylate cyclase